jgi:DNA-binding response OmpR family regulator
LSEVRSKETKGKKLETGEENRLLHTVRGMGYVLREPS